MLLLLIVMPSVTIACASAHQTRNATDESKLTVLFMCPYGGVKSLIAASYFNRLADAEGLPYVASAAAADTPYDAVPQPVAEFLEKDGFTVASFKPRLVAPVDLMSAAKIVSSIAI